MRHHLTGFAVFSLLLAVAPAGSAGLPDGDAEAGRAVAVGASAAGAAGACQSCHGIEGAGDAAAAFPRLSGLSREYLAKSLADYARGRRQNEIMTPIARALTEKEIVDVATYYETTTGVMANVGATPSAEALQRGGILSAIGDSAIGVQGCQNCHGPAGRGFSLYPALAGQSALYLKAQLEAWKAGEREGDPDNVMREIAKRLSPADVEAVAAYFAAIRPRAGVAALTGSADVAPDATGALR